MTIKHKIKLKISNFFYYLSLVPKAIVYRKEIKELRVIEKKKRDLTFRMLEIQRTIPDNDETKEIKAKLSILNEITCNQ